MRSITPQLLTIVAFLQLIILPLFAKERDQFVVEIRILTESDTELSNGLLEINKKFGAPIWDKTMVKTFGSTRIAITPIIDFSNDFANGIVVFLEQENQKIQYKFFSREQLIKRYVGKKKNKIAYRNDLIASFLKFDLKLYNIIEPKFTDAIGFNGIDKEGQILNFEIRSELMDVFL